MESSSASNTSTTLIRRVKAVSLMHSVWRNTFADGHPICVVLGDNIIEGDICSAAEEFRRRSRGAHILLKEVQDAERFGVAEVANSRVIGIEEKPLVPKSNYAVTGIYMYDATVFQKIKTLVPSNRGELEITDVNNAYIREGTMGFSFLQGWWSDAGTFDSLLHAANLVAQSRVGKNGGHPLPTAR
jgi:glucose-1-phosphate thymidylyltransferase